jgi:hypothetical protein
MSKRCSVAKLGSPRPLGLAALLRVADEAKLKELQRIECPGCTISADALR